jgi:hypothetical protein
MLKARLIAFEVAPGSLKPMVELEKTLKNSGLVKTRASQINGCAYNLLAENVVSHPDGGGVRNAALNPLFGLRRSPAYSSVWRARAEASCLLSSTRG